MTPPQLLDATPPDPPRVHPQSLEELLSGCGIVHADLVRNAVERDALDQPGEPQAVVPVEVRDQDVVNAGSANTGHDHLALGPFPGIEEQTAPVPPNEVAVVVAVACRDLTGGSEDDQLSGDDSRISRREPSDHARFRRETWKGGRPTESERCLPAGASNPIHRREH